jgi:hypothetical protein
MVKRLSVSFAFAVCSSANAALVTIDFSGPHHQEIVTDQFTGVNIALLGSPPIAGPRAWILNDNQGNPVNVLGATGNAITPSVGPIGEIQPPFYDIQFSLAQPVDFFAIQVLDAEEAVTANAYLGNTVVQSVKQGTFLGSHSGSVFNGPVYEIALGFINGPIHFDRVVIDLTENDGPELYDNVAFNTLAVVPEPGATAFLIGAILALLITRLRWYRDTVCSGAQRKRRDRLFPCCRTIFAFLQPCCSSSCSRPIDRSDRTSSRR